MLILTRRPGESVKIGDDITVTVLGIKGNQLRLGFTAPAHVAVHREEVYRRIQAEKLTNISEARSANSALRLLARSPGSSSEASTSAHSVGDPTAQACVEPSPARGRLKVSPQTRKELLKW